MAKDTRIPYGTRCTWWDSIDKVGHTSAGQSGHALPCCPHCGGMLFEVESEKVWFDVADRYEADGHPGYRAMLEWSRGKCFPDFAALRDAFERSLS